jgi:hypothetical protein
MASLPALPTLRRTNTDTPSPQDLAAQGDAKLNLARRLRDEDQARRTTSVAPPAR